jgi:hypothetical protein
MPRRKRAVQRRESLFGLCVIKSAKSRRTGFQALASYELGHLSRRWATGGPAMQFPHNN